MENKRRQCSQKQRLSWKRQKSPYQCGENWKQLTNSHKTLRVVMGEKTSNCGGMNLFSAHMQINENRK